MEKEKMNNQNKPPYHSCPRFDKCSANRCPFDPEIDRKEAFRGEEKCRLAKSRRMRLYESLPEEKKSLLPYRGMFKREFSGWKRWQDLPEEEKAKKKAALTAQIQKSRFVRGN